MKIPLAAISEAGVRNIVRELRSLWMYLDDVHPRAQVKVTKDPRGYNIYVNGRALQYIMLFCSKLKPLEIKTDEPINLDDIPF